MTAADRRAMRAAQDELAAAAELHVTHRRSCSRLGCAERMSLSRAVLHCQRQVGLMRFDRASDDELELG